jgi:hypothetical protein
MLKFEKSEYADSIYYADMFHIESLTWMIMGFGKSDAARLASSKERARDLSRDCVAIREVSGELQGRYDPGGINPEVTGGLFDFHKINCVAYCLSPDETSRIYQGENRDIRIIDKEIMSQISVSYPYPAYVAPQLFSEDELLWLSNRSRRIEQFLKVVSRVHDVFFVIVPYMESAAQKASLYVSFSKGVETQQVAPSDASKLA